MNVTSPHRLACMLLGILTATTTGGCQGALVIDGFPIGERRACEGDDFRRCNVIITAALAGLEEREPGRVDIDGTEVFWLDDRGARVTGDGTRNVVVIDMTHGPSKAIGVDCTEMGCGPRLEYEAPNDEGS